MLKTDDARFLGKIIAWFCLSWAIVNFIYQLSIQNWPVNSGGILNIGRHPKSKETWDFYFVWCIQASQTFSIFKKIPRGACRKSNEFTSFENKDKRNFILTEKFWNNFFSAMLLSAFLNHSLIVSNVLRFFVSK